MNTLTNFFTELMRKYLPDPFVFAIGLTILTMSLAIVVEQQSLVTTIDNWGAGFWNLLGFTTQMAVILVMGYVLARAPLVDALLSGLTSRVQRPPLPWSSRRSLAPWRAISIGASGWSSEAFLPGNSQQSCVACTIR